MKLCQKYFKYFAFQKVQFLLPFCYSYRFFFKSSGLRGGKPNKKADFTVDTRDAGYGGLGLSVEGPSKVEINCVDNEDGTCSVDFTPAEAGQYLINVTYADVHVPGSPFKCRVGDGPMVS